MMKSKLSADPTTLIFGIISLLIVVLGCCCGLAAIVSLGFSIAGLILANNSLREYEFAPENYDYKSRTNVSTGKVLCIIGIVISAIVTIIWIIYFIIVGSIASDDFLEKINRYNDTHYEISKDTVNHIYNGEIESETVITVDTISVDTIK